MHVFKIKFVEQKLKHDNCLNNDLNIYILFLEYYIFIWDSLCAFKLI